MPGEPPLAPLAARPRPATPILILASSGLLLALTGAAAAQRSWLLAAWLVLAALVPWTPRDRLRQLGVALAWAGIVGCFVGIALVPFGARVTAALLPAGAAFAARVVALRTEGVIRWVDPRWTALAAAVEGPLEEALAAALLGGARAPAKVDAAVAALAAAPRAAIPAGEVERRAFWINAYNALALHAGWRRSSTRLVDVLEIFRTEYLVAGARLTLDEIEHGLLRDGAANPAAPWARMSDGDPRRRLAVPLDPRVHFALHCGAVSCPLVRVYRGDALDEQLDAATQSFLAAESSFDAARGVIETSRILRWYARDFGGPAGVRARIARALGVEEAALAKARLRYRAYDWARPA